MTLKIISGDKLVEDYEEAAVELLNVTFTIGPEEIKRLKEEYRQKRLKECP